jgi:hypothetical protein
MSKETIIKKLKLELQDYIEERGWNFTINSSGHSASEDLNVYIPDIDVDGHSIRLFPHSARLINGSECARISGTEEVQSRISAAKTKLIAFAQIHGLSPGIQAFNL